ncbi:MAG: Eco57I restriction-modification methylase domain-containing protein [Victivallaceae bacterium]|nr:Eco57I restriction-modification methylase domain-containing protein [Victivallaceae bacterium]
MREIAKRLLVGLEPKIPKLQDRIDHIFQKQLYGIAITELTGLLSRRSVYCSKDASSSWTVSKFQNRQGNIIFKRIKHTWQNGKCIQCGASQSEYDRTDNLETHAYQFIHKSIKQIFGANMKFDVIVGNPPYQLSDGGHGVSAKPIYHLFVQQAKRMNPRYLTMIIPARWYAGGKGLDEFRAEMLNDKRISHLVDYDNSASIFPGVDVAGGICYFLWQRDSCGECSITNFSNDKKNIMSRSLNEFSTLIRSNQAVSILRKVITAHGNNPYLCDRVSARKPFGLPTNYQPQDSGIPCWFIQRIGLKYAQPELIDSRNPYLNQWKLLVPPAPIAGQTDFSKPVGFYYAGNTRISKPGECCTESYIIAAAFDTESETLAFRSYLFTKIIRFLLLQTVVSQHVTAKNFCFVPDLVHYEGEYTDLVLCQRWGISAEEWSYIDSKIAVVGRGENE